MLVQNNDKGLEIEKILEDLDIDIEPIEEMLEEDEEKDKKEK